jgi:hypothetical protein
MKIEKYANRKCSLDSQCLDGRGKKKRSTTRSGGRLDIHGRNVFETRLSRGFGK